MVTYTPRALMLALGAAALLAGCEVRGVIGSNVGMDGGAGDGVEDGMAGPGGPTSADDGASDATGAGEGGAGGTTTGGADDAGNDTTIFDLGAPDAPATCMAPLPVQCDHEDDDPWHAMGINCDQGVLATVSYSGDARSLHVHEGILGTSGTYEPREGVRMVVLSTGEAAELALSPAELAATGCSPVACPSQQFTAAPIPKLPDPIEVRRVADDGRNCVEDPTLVGEGDCSNTLQAQWSAGSGAHDYTELRMQATVPEGADAFAYQFAFFTVEYPLFADHETAFNDMYLAWLQSESWTGNVSFDGDGNPVSIQGVFLEYRDADTAECPGCTAPELAGFAAQGHAGTDWLSTVAPVTAGEDIELIFAVMDLTDGIFDSAVVLDGFEWTCTDLPPITTPVG